MVNVKLHGILGEDLGFPEWKLNVHSVAEAIRAIEANTKRFYKLLLENDKKNIKYKVIINGKNFKTSEKINPYENPENVKNLSKTELVGQRKNLKTIDIVPIIEGASEDLLGILTIIVGVVLVIVGIVQTNPALIIAGIGLIAGGVTSLLIKPPKFQDFREIDGATGRTSYLFNGPQNTTNEGGPVPIVYGRVLVGSQVISASYKISNIEGEESENNDGGVIIFNTNTKNYKTTIKTNPEIDDSNIIDE